MKGVADIVAGTPFENVSIDMDIEELKVNNNSNNKSYIIKLKENGECIGRNTISFNSLDKSVAAYTLNHSKQVEKFQEF